MPNTLSYRKPPRTPPGCEGHLTRQQAAQLLGFSSEFKIRRLEREGRLQSVRGPMRTAFYARADVLAVKAELGREGLGQETPDGWTDAELLHLLASPNREGRQRTALDLVLETRISIERAERVFAFWAGSRIGGAAEATKPAAATSPSVAVAAPVSTDVVKPKASTAGYPPAPGHAPAVAVAAPNPPPAQTTTAQPPSTPATIVVQSARVEGLKTASDDNERRGEDRLSRDSLIAQLRDPDPRVRDRAFARLREIQSGR